MKITSCFMLSFFALFFCLQTAWSATPTASLPISGVTSIYDGDTFSATIAGCDMPILCERIPIRIEGIDTPELRGQCQAEIDKARLAKQYLVGRLRSAKIIELKNPVRDKYFRIRAAVWVDGADVGEEMIKNNLARRYNGGRRGGWCEVV